MTAARMSLPCRSVLAALSSPSNHLLLHSGYDSEFWKQNAQLARANLLLHAQVRSVCKTALATAMLSMAAACWLNLQSHSWLCLASTDGIQERQLLTSIRATQMHLECSDISGRSQNRPLHEVCMMRSCLRHWSCVEVCNQIGFQVSAFPLTCGCRQHISGIISNS